MNQPRKQALTHSMAFSGAPAPHHYRPHILPNLCVSLKQWRILHAVIDCGGFAEAAKFLHLSQSAISYTMAKLQEQLGIQLLKLEGRKAILTAEGRTLLERSRHVLKEAIELETFAKNMEQDWAGQVSLIADHNFPTNLLMSALGNFKFLGSGASHVQLSVIAAPQTEEILSKLAVDLVISERVPLGFLGEPLIEVEHIPVAHPEYPLLQLGRDLTTADLARYIQIGIGHLDAPEKSNTNSQDYMYRWNMNSFDAVVEAVLEGLGYAWLPAHRIEKWLADGALARLPFGDRRQYKTILYLVHAHPWSASSAVNRLVDVLRSFASAELDKRSSTSN